MTRTARRILISLFVGGVFFYLAFRNVPFEDLVGAFERFDGRWLLPAVAVSLALQLLRVWRWQLELRPLERVPFGRLWVVTSVAYMCINLLPARLGEFVRPWLLSRRAGVSFSNVVGNLVIEKTLDSLVILFYILVGLASCPTLPQWVRTGAMVPASMAALLVGLVLLFWWRGESFVDRWLICRLPPGAGERLKKVLQSIIDGMRILPDTRLLKLVFAVSFVLWFLPILSSYIVICAFDFAVPFSAAVIVFVFIGFGTALPNAPGMVGTYQYACVLALELFGVGKPDALAYGLVLNAVQLLTLLAQGLVALPFAGVNAHDVWRARRELPGAQCST